MLHTEQQNCKVRSIAMNETFEIKIDGIEITDTSDDLDGSLIQDVLLQASGSSSSSSSSGFETAALA